MPVKAARLYIWSRTDVSTLLILVTQFIFVVTFIISVIGTCNFRRVLRPLGPLVTYDCKIQYTYMKMFYEGPSKNNLHKIPKNWKMVGEKWNQFYYKLHSKSYFSTYASISERHFWYRVINFEIPSAKKFLSSFAKYYAHHPQDSFDLQGRNGAISSPHRTLLRHHILPLAADRWRWQIHHALWGNG